jgi:hypothetical protein
VRSLLRGASTLRTTALHSATIEQAKQEVPDIKVLGNANAWQLICRVSSEAEGWVRSTKAMYIQGVGCLVRVTTQCGEAVAESLTFVPGVKIEPDTNEGHCLVFEM